MKISSIEYLEDCFDKYIRWQIGDFKAEHYDTTMFYEDLDKAKKMQKIELNQKFSNEEVIDILQKRLMSIGLVISLESTQIWFNQYKK